MMSLADVPWNHFNIYNHNHNFPDSHHLPLSPYLHPASFAFSHAAQRSSALHRNYAPLDMAALSPDELERFQKLSNEFEPDVQVSVDQRLG